MSKLQGKARRLTYHRVSKASRLTFPGSNLALISPAPSVSGQQNRPKHSLFFAQRDSSFTGQCPGHRCSLSPRPSRAASWASNSAIRALSGSAYFSTSAAVKRGVMYCGQFQS